MKYQLVIQFPESVYGDVDWLAGLEDRLDEHLVNAEIDGHDIGNSEVNIFVHTNTPVETFETVKNLLTECSSVLNDVKIAYRDISDEKYICLWPKGLTGFNVI